MQIERSIIHSAEPGEPCFGIPPKDLNSINMTFIMNKLVWFMVDSEMFLVSDINEFIVNSPTVGMYNSLEVNATPYDPLQRGFSAVRNNLSKNTSNTSEHFERNCCT